MRWIYLIQLHFANKRLRDLIDSWTGPLGLEEEWLAKFEIAKGDVQSLLKKLEK
jgi:hypothetical protein